MKFRKGKEKLKNCSRLKDIKAIQLNATLNFRLDAGTEFFYFYFFVIKGHYVHNLANVECSLLIR